MRDTQDVSERSAQAQKKKRPTKTEKLFIVVMLIFFSLSISFCLTLQDTLKHNEFNLNVINIEANAMTVAHNPIIVSPKYFEVAAGQL